MFPYILTNRSLTIIINNKQYAIDDNHVNFRAISEKIKNNDESDIEKLISIKNAINGYTVTYDIIIGDDDIIYYKNEPIHSSLTNRIIEIYKQGFDVYSLVLFLENLYQNPLQSAIDELYDFLSIGNLPLTDDGHFLAYKKVNKDYKDIYSNSIDNSIGQVVKMDRISVDPNRNQTCSYGLHFCSKDYLAYFGSNDDPIMILKINPKDVVSIPIDYNNTKGRCCQYEVIGEYSQEDSIKKDIQDSQMTSSIATIDFGELSIKKQMVYALLKQFMRNEYGLTENDIWNLSNLRFDDNDGYEKLISMIMDLFDEPISRDTAVRHFKYFKDKK